MLTVPAKLRHVTCVRGWVQTIVVMRLLREKHLELALNGPVIDEMYFIVIDEKYWRKSLVHKLYVLALAKLLFKRHRLYFSTGERKYAYMEKIGQITQEVTDVIKGKIAKKAIYNCVGICIVCFVAYKYL